MNWKKISIVLLLTLAIGLAAGVFSARSLWKYKPRLVCGNECQNSVTSDRLFFADEIFLQGTSDEGEPFLLHLDLNRKKVGSRYQHYYYADLISQKTHRQLYTSFLNENSLVQPKDFLKSFSVQMAEDLSAREYYSLEFSSSGTSIKAQNLQFDGDFLVKNTPEYTKYVSSGSGNISLNGKLRTANTAAVKIYSSDYGKYVFFNGYDTLKSLSQFFVLWADDGSFILVDSSKVAQELEGYKSHTWVLSKDGREGLMSKAFTAKVVPSLKNGIPGSWSIDIPPFNSSLSLSVAQFTTGNSDDGLAEGVWEKGQSRQKVRGYFSYTQYGN